MKQNLACIPIDINGASFFDFKEGTESIPTFGNAFELLLKFTRHPGTCKSRQINTVNWLYHPPVMAFLTRLHLYLKKNLKILLLLLVSLIFKTAE